VKEDHHLWWWYLYDSSCLDNMHLHEHRGNPAVFLTIRKDGIEEVLQNVARVKHVT
jgi:hypothetical protein